MANIKIVTDSSITIEPEVVEEYGITIVPLSVMVDGVLYSDSELGEGDFLRLIWLKPQSSKAECAATRKLFPTCSLKDCKAPKADSVSPVRYMTPLHREDNQPEERYLLNNCLE